MDDCTRLRDIVEAYRAHTEQRFMPCLILVTWAATDGPEAAVDFMEMVRKLSVLVPSAFSKLHVVD